MDDFHNLNVANTQSERILINAVHVAILLLDICQFQSKLTSLIVGVFEKLSVEYIFPHFLPFNLLSKSLISSDLQ